jgi:hypothetical protein
MTISAKDTIAAEAVGGTRSEGTRAYFQARLKNRLHNLVLGKFNEAESSENLTRAELARRIGKRPEVLTRLLGAPGNWTLDTISDLLLGIAGYELDATATRIASKAVRNSNYPTMQSRIDVDLNRPASQTSELQLTDPVSPYFVIGIEHAIQSPTNHGYSIPNS